MFTNKSSHNNAIKPWEFLRNTSTTGMYLGKDKSTFCYVSIAARNHQLPIEILRYKGKKYCRLSCVSFYISLHQSKVAIMDEIFYITVD